MDKHAFQTELNRVAFTPAGREALTEALLRREAVPDRRRPGGWARMGLAAALAAVALIGSAVAAGTLWERYFGRLDETQQEMIGTLSRELPAAESNGTVMTPLAAFGDQDFYYLMLEIRAPEGTVLPDYSEDEGYYQLFNPDTGESVTLLDGAGNDIRGNLEFEWMPRTGDSQVLTVVIRLWPIEGVNFSDGTDKVLHIPGLWVQSPDKLYTPVLSGSWDFNIGTHTGNVENRTLDTTGVAVEDERFGTVTLDALRVSPLGLYYRSSWAHGAEDDTLLCPPLEISVVMADGKEIYLDNTIGSGRDDECWYESYGPFEAPIDLSKAVCVRWNGAEIPIR